MKDHMNTDSRDLITAEAAKEHDDHWQEVLQLAEKHGFIRQAYGGTAVLITHQNTRD